MTTKEELLEELTISLPGRLLGRQDGAPAAIADHQQRSETDYRGDPEYWRAQYEAAQEELGRLQTEVSLAWSRVEQLRGQLARLQCALLGAAG
jgi:hypothetical protein